MALLEVSELSIQFGGVKAVQAVSFSIDAGMIYAVIGPNGAGKTTLFNLITGVYAPTAGSIRLDGQPVHGLTPDRLAQRGHRGAVFAHVQAAFHADHHQPEGDVLLEVEHRRRHGLDAAHHVMPGNRRQPARAHLGQHGARLVQRLHIGAALAAVQLGLHQGLDLRRRQPGGKHPASGRGQQAERGPGDDIDGDWPARALPAHNHRPLAAPHRQRRGFVDGVAQIGNRAQPQPHPVQPAQRHQAQIERKRPQRVARR